MKNIFKTLVVGLIFIASNIYGYAQNIADEDPNWRTDSAALHQKIDSIFMHLDKAKITTGYLFERINMMLSGMQYYNGYTGSIIEANQWHQMYFELKHFAEISPSALPSSNDVIKRAKNSNTDNIIPLGIINMDINRVKTIALDSGLLYIQNDELYENSSNSQSPYEVRKVFAISPLNNDPLHSTTTFFIDTSFYFTNDTNQISHFEIDFGDGTGYRTVNFGEQITVNYGGLDSVIINSKAFSAADTLRSKSLAFAINIQNIQNKSIGSSIQSDCICDKIKIPMDKLIIFNPIITVILRRYLLMV